MYPLRAHGLIKIFEPDQNVNYSAQTEQTYRCHILWMFLSIAVLGRQIEMKIAPH